ncbi:RAD52 family DNA repair protein [Bradyrhizobium japonicum]|uniref:RAD52 family DNA repair protein n=1 Tax=Bradyrhizobium japonicum TaxID=375 RepID=UPI001BA9DFA1|nr:RAD52 family DNA repair protein [Bradyrhizobium japonicum]MBR0802866.1 RAD52 family DNA repair protein [Bradyrhizobium japonicum]
MTKFNDEQKLQLSSPLNRSYVKERRQGGRQFSYIEGWQVIAEANRIFGYDGWQRETIFATVVADYEREIGENKLPGFGVTYVCKVRVTVGDVVREGCGSGHGIDRDRGLAHESAIKEAETDAMKRALMTFGNPFGLALYDKQQTNVVDESEIVYQRYIMDTRDIIEAFGDDHEGRVRWWMTDEQKLARRNIGLRPDDVTVLKNLVASKAPKKP